MILRQARARARTTVRKTEYAYFAGMAPDTCAARDLESNNHHADPEQEAMRSRCSTNPP
jgi:hypothetical protein